MGRSTHALPHNVLVIERRLPTDSDLTLDALPAEQVLAGAPRAGSRRLTDLGDHEVGIWEHTVGSSSDVEADEVFVVLSGRGAVAFDDGEVVDLSPGTAVRLRAGERTTWTITATLRKVYVA